MPCAAACLRTRICGPRHDLQPHPPDRNKYCGRQQRPVPPPRHRLLLHPAHSSGVGIWTTAQPRQVLRHTLDLHTVPARGLLLRVLSRCRVLRRQRRYVRACAASCAPDLRGATGVRVMRQPQQGRLCGGSIDTFLCRPMWNGNKRCRRFHADRDGKSYAASVHNLSLFRTKTKPGAPRLHICGEEWIE